MKLSLIVAMAQNRVIGKDNQLPWRLSGDLKRFKEITMGHHLLMGRNTFDSIGRPLPGRTSLILTRRPKENKENEWYFSDIDSLLKHAENRGESELFVIGGGNIYQQFVSRVETMYITKVHADIEGDTHFPVIDWQQWKLVKREDYSKDEKNQYNWSLEIWDRL